MKKAVVLAVLSLVSAGFAQSNSADFAPPPRQVVPQSANPVGPPPNIADLMRQNGGSLRRAAMIAADDPRVAKPSDMSYFYVPDPKPKTLLKHDLVTIVVSEQSSFSSDGTTDTKKDTGVDAKVDAIPTFSLSNFALKNAIGSVSPELKASANRNYKGQGTVDRKDTFTTRIQAEVVDVKPNGTLVLQARKRISTDEEEQLMILNGVCRVQDITPDNTVLSTQLYDMDIKRTSKGAVRDSTKRGWVPRLLDWANPF